MARRRSGKKIDFTHWTYQSGSALALSAGTTAVLFNAAQHEPETLLRFRGELFVGLDALSAPGGLAAIGVGLILVPEGTGSTVLWSPITDGDAPWFWVDYGAVGYEEGVTDVIDYPGYTSYRRVIDSKAMRIIRNQEIQMVVENATVGTAESVNVVLQGRFLSGT